MWQVDPAIMCRQHLLGEHRELHALYGCLRENISLDGYLKYGLLQLDSLWRRHDDLVWEMEARGYNHKSPLPDRSSLPQGTQLPGEVDQIKSLTVLLNRCERCLERWNERNPMHDKEYPLAGQTVLAYTTRHPDLGEGPHSYKIIDWWDRLNEKSWMFSEGNPAALAYAMRVGDGNLPMDNEVVYGHIGSLGLLVHVSELEGND